MAGNRIGGLKAAATNRSKFGEDFYTKIGSIGGQNGRTSGFYQNREAASAAGRKGGTLSKRGYRLVGYDESDEPIYAKI